jgi:hypothetical protein
LEDRNKEVHVYVVYTVGKKEVQSGKDPVARTPGSLPDDHRSGSEVVGKHPKEYGKQIFP